MIVPPPVIPGDLAARSRNHFDERNRVFDNPTPEAARAFCKLVGFPFGETDDEALALVHHWRLRWLDATDAMMAESAAFLAAHPELAVKLKGPEPLTPLTRDIRRMESGRPPVHVPGASQR